MRFAKWVPIINSMYLLGLIISCLYYFDTDNMDYIHQGIRVVFSVSFLLIIINLVFAFGLSELYETANSTTKIRAVAREDRKNGDVVVYGFVNNTNDLAIRVVKGPKTNRLGLYIQALPEPSSFKEICLKENQIVYQDVMPALTITCLDLKEDSQ